MGRAVVERWHATEQALETAEQNRTQERRARQAAEQERDSERLARLAAEQALAALQEELRRRGSNQ